MQKALRVLKYLLLILIVVAVAVGLVLSNFRFLYMAGGDTALYINPKAFWNSMIYLWDADLSYTTGGQSLSVNLFMPFVLLFKLFSYLPTMWVEYGYFVAVFSGMFLAFFYYAYNYLYKKHLPAILASLLYVFNTFFFVSFVNYNIHLSFIMLPLLFVLCHQIAQKKFRAIFVVTCLISVVLPSAAINPPAVVPLVPTMCFYLVFLIVKNRVRIWDKKFAAAVLLAVGSVVLINFWWLYAFIHQVYENSIVQLVSTIATSQMFKTTSVFDAFRFLGGWAFNPEGIGINEGRYDSLYYKGLFIVCTYITVILAYTALFFTKKNRTILFFLLLAFLGISLAKGTLQPFGQVYRFLYNKVPGFFMFREPYTKFMPIYVFAMAPLLGFAAFYCPLRLKKFFYVGAFVCVLVYSYPFFIGGFVPLRTQVGPGRSYLVKVPDYVEEYSRYVDAAEADYKVLSVPRVSHTYLWESGFTILNSVLQNFTQRTMISSVADPYTRGVGEHTGALYSLLERGDDVYKIFLGLLNIGQIVQENDLDWRYRAGITMPPTKNTQDVERAGFEKVADFGQFTPQYLEKIPNRDPDESLQNELYVELLNKPVLSLYDVDEAHYLPHFYVPKHTVYIAGFTDRLKDLLKLNSYDIRTQFYIVDGKPNRGMLSISDDIAVMGRKVEVPIKLEGIVWDSGWDWPNPSVSPESWRYLFVQIKEAYLLFREHNVQAEADLLMRLAAKRVNELKKYDTLSGKVRERLVKKFISLSNRSIELLKEEEKNKSKNSGAYWALIGKMYLFSGRSTSELMREGFDREDVKEVYRSFGQWIRETAATGCEDYCYVFQAPREEQYNLLIHDTYKKKQLDDVQLDEYLVSKYDYAWENDRVIFYKDKLDKREVSTFIKLDEWESLKSYKVSFDYKLDDCDVYITVLEDHPYYKLGVDAIDWDTVFGGDFTVRRREIYKNVLSFSQICLDTESECFSHFEALVNASYGNQDGYLYIEIPPDDWGKREVEIRNIKVEEYQEPVLALEKKGAKLDTAIPKISFTRINPTKYKIHVTGARDPYTLVFSESYHRLWRIYLHGSDTKSFKEQLMLGWLGKVGSSLVTQFTKDRPIGHKVGSYFNGDIEETEHSTVFLEPSTFETWGQRAIALDTHYMVNGYANSWYIKPEDVNGLEDYELIVEFWPQRFYYFTIIVSGLAVVAGSVWFAAGGVLRLIRGKHAD